LKLRLEFGSLTRVLIDLAEDDFELGAWIIVIARSAADRGARKVLAR
jgi:hypothetical protein